MFRLWLTPGVDFNTKYHIAKEEKLRDWRISRFQKNIHSLPLFNLSLIGEFSWLTPPGPYKATAFRERELTLDYIHTFLTTQGWGNSSMPGPPTKQHELERRFTPFTHPFILASRIWKDDYDGQMIFGDLVTLKLSDICLTGEEKPRTKLHPENLSPWQAAHATAWSTVVDMKGEE